MLLVTSFGVMFSTFLSGAVAMMATLAALVLGFFTQFVFDVATGTVEGGGPIESLIRIVNQRNVTTQMEPGLTRDVVQARRRGVHVLHEVGDQPAARFSPASATSTTWPTASTFRPT